MLAESGLKRRSRYATATLLIGANLPDIDALAELHSSDFELYARRGHTHGILAMVVLPLVLAAAVWLWHRWRASTQAGGSGQPGAATGTSVAAIDGSGAGAPPFNPRAVLALAFLAVWSHPLLDWLNTYGVRLLMPFDGRWFYGDTLFIIDPWVWLLAAAGVVMSHAVTARALAGWVLLALLTSALVLATTLVPPGVKIIWCAGVTAIAWLRWWQPAWGANGALARAALLCLVLYVGAMHVIARVAEASVAKQYAAATDVQANPLPGTPLAQRMVVVEPDAYRIRTPQGEVHTLPRVQPDAIVRRALADPSIRGFVKWMRLPHWTVEDDGDHWRVRFLDLRYQGPDLPEVRDIGFAQVLVPKSSADSGFSCNLQR